MYIQISSEESRPISVHHHGGDGSYEGQSVEILMGNSNGILIQSEDDAEQLMRLLAEHFGFNLVAKV